MSSNTVVVAVDGSKNSEKAFEYYCQRLHRPENNVVILHAAEEPNIQGSGTYHWAPTTATRDDYKKLLDQQQKSVNDLKSRFSSLSQKFKVPVKVESLHCNRAADCIVDYSKKNHADSIVVGSRGMGTIRRTFLGSVSDYVLHHSDRPVTVIPSE